MQRKNGFCLYAAPLSSITSYFQMVDLAAEYGIPYLETLNIMELSVPDVAFARKLRAYADEKGITIACVSVGMDLVGEDHREALEQIKAYAEVAAVLGSPYLHHTIALEFDDARRIADNFDLFYERGLAAVREVYDYAQRFGIRAIYEDQGFLFNGVENFGRFLREVDREVGVVADFGNIQFADEDVEDFIAAFHDRIVHVHAKDYLVTPGFHRSRKKTEYVSRGGSYLQDCLVGAGSVHVDLAFQALQKMGYHGPVALESGPVSADQEGDFRRNLEMVNRYIDRYL